MTRERMKWMKIWSRSGASSETCATWPSTWATKSTLRTARSTGLWRWLILTKLGLMRPTSVPQRCWEVAKLQNKHPLTPINTPDPQSPTPSRPLHCTSHGALRSPHSVRPPALHTCTYQHLAAPPVDTCRSVSSVFTASPSV
ncbi:hypothetical protein AOLI_G00117910 [Acnodon oligacanthus]